LPAFPDLLQDVARTVHGEGVYFVPCYEGACSLHYNAHALSDRVRIQRRIQHFGLWVIWAAVGGEELSKDEATYSTPISVSCSLANQRDPNRMPINEVKVRRAAPDLSFVRPNRMSL
jgi:hypothetical protein